VKDRPGGHQADDASRNGHHLFYAGTHDFFSLVPASGTFLFNRYDIVIFFLIGTGLSLCTSLLSDKLKGQEMIKFAVLASGEN
jgi:hypothetical protein